ncbi:unnamed protein product [Peronospora belbahrii]|uniref:Uncharacterized protein n=1 Tax=Peronospora belbahrii TaxID=622444 RepID=A0ABN8CQ75_9STRA|nr:unnamed protein product [Peronospora belbahrii]
MEYRIKHDDSASLNVYARCLFYANVHTTYSLTVLFELVGGMKNLINLKKLNDDVKIGEDSYELYDGIFGNFEGYIFVANKGNRRLNIDFNGFFKALPKNSKINSNQYLYSLSVGSQVVQGSGTVKFIGYSAAVKA